MKIAVLGGSFNPFHIGHAMLADTVIKELHYDKVLIVPAFKAPHKNSCDGIKSVTPEQRFSMVKAFCDSQENPIFVAEDCEIKREGISYTCDTLEFLTQKYKDQLDGKLAFIMGDEVAAEFEKWKNPDKVAFYADFIITHRYPEASVIENRIHTNQPSLNYKGDFKVQFNKDDFKYPFVYLKDPLMPVSSTEIRNRIREGKSFKYLVPSAIYEYIVKHGIYRE